MTPHLAPAWLAEPAVAALLAAFAAAGVEARFVGGAVRDALLDQPPGNDLDLATPAQPERVIAVLRQAGIKVVPTGLAHGTVTAIVPPRVFEITTLRRDVETDGRHALVAFGAAWAEDAARRDFTINAIYLAPDGTLADPVGGIADLRAGHVRFVGDAGRRIAEDVLRLLRYYRFEARFGRGAGDLAARAACRDAVTLLPTLSAERVAGELLRLLDVADPMPALVMMAEDGVLRALLPEIAQAGGTLDALRGLLAIEPERDPWRRLAALVATDRIGMAALAARLRLGNAARDRLAGLARPWPLDPGGGDQAQRRALYECGATRYRDLVLLQAAAGRLDPARRTVLLDLSRDWTPPAFPLGGGDVTALGVAPGPRVGQLLAAVRGWWEDGDFAADRAACLDRLALLAK